MRILVTRPRSEGEALAARLREVGIDSLLEPILDLVTLPHFVTEEVDPAQASEEAASMTGLLSKLWRRHSRTACLSR